MKYIHLDIAQNKRLHLASRVSRGCCSNSHLNFWRVDNFLFCSVNFVLRYFEFLASKWGNKIPCLLKSLQCAQFHVGHLLHSIRFLYNWDELSMFHVYSTSHSVQCRLLRFELVSYKITKWIAREKKKIDRGKWADWSAVRRLIIM